ncbi:MAG: glycosyltransferase family 4 protein [Chitinispirillaceae bacterium]|nr:glycosyltransferase family 4 protein [Chitinispirillaceae bacterium]
MKRVFIIYLGSRGGGALDTYEIASALAKVGKHSYSLMISENNSLFPKYKSIHLENLFVVKTFKKSFLSLFLNTLLLVNILKIIKIIHREKPDVLFFTMFHPWIPIVAIISKIMFRNTKIVHVVHNPLNFEAVESKLYNKIINKLEELMVKISDNVITLSKSSGEYLVNRIKVSSNKIKILRFGGHDKAFRESFNHKGFAINNKIRLLFFGRILKYKGIDILINSYSMMLEEGIDVSLTIAGEGPIDAELLEKAKKLEVNLINRWLNEEELLRLLEETDIVVIPYKQASQSGPASIATSLGVPVIATKVGGLTEQVFNRVNGILVKPNSPEEIKEAVKMFIKDRKLFYTLSEGAKNLAKDYLSWENIIKEMEELWN